MGILKQLEDKSLIRPPSFLVDNTLYACITGSHAYGCNDPDKSDYDIVGFCIPPKALVFPHQVGGEIEGFGKQKERFKQWQQHHIKDGPKDYDLTIHSIVRFFHLCMENNPNMLDVLFSPRELMVISTPIAEKVRFNRHLFLHKGSYHKFTGYCHSQISKLRTKTPDMGSKRKADFDKYGYCVKFASHALRLLEENKQILEEGDLDLRRSSELLKAVRRGDWSLERVLAYVARQEPILEQLYHSSKLPHSPDEDAIKALLVECLEMHFGSLAAVQNNQHRDAEKLRQIQSILEE